MKYINADELFVMLEKMAQAECEINTRVATIQEIQGLIVSLQQEIEHPEKYQTPDWLWKKLEQPEVDLEKEMDKFYGMYRDKTGKTYDVKDNEPCFDWKEDELSEHEKRLARHFYELGKNSK